MSLEIKIEARRNGKPICSGCGEVAPGYDRQPARDFEYVPLQARLARLRGALPAEEPGARGIERVARNPACTRLRALTMASITPASAVKDVYGETVSEGQLPFALAAGNRFEEDLFASGAAKLLELYISAGRLEPQECKVVVVPDHDRSLEAGASIQLNMAMGQLVAMQHQEQAQFAALEETRKIVNQNERTIETSERSIEVAEKNSVYANRAYVAASIAQIEEGFQFYLYVENTGNTPANNVSITYRVELRRNAYC